MFKYVDHIDAVGTLYQEACVRWVDTLRNRKEDEAAKWDAALNGIREAWPELVKESVEKTSG